MVKSFTEYATELWALVVPRLSEQFRVGSWIDHSRNMFQITAWQRQWPEGEPIRYAVTYEVLSQARASMNVLADAAVKQIIDTAAAWNRHLLVDAANRNIIANMWNEYLGMESQGVPVLPIAQKQEDLPKSVFTELPPCEDQKCLAEKLERMKNRTLTGTAIEHMQAETRAYKEYLAMRWAQW